MSKKIDTEVFKVKKFEGYTVWPAYKNAKTIDLDVDYWDDYFGSENSVTLDAVDVYKNLKEYFKGTEHE